MSKADELAKLFELKKQGILSEEEFAREKTKLLAADVPGNGLSQPPKLDHSAPIPEHIDAASNFAASDLLQMACPKCKGEVQFLPGLELLSCTFCGNEMPVQAKDLLSSAKIPDQLISFQITRQEAEKGFYNLLANDDLVPDDIFDDKNAITLFGAYYPAFLFSGKYEGNWTALSIVKYTVTRGDKSHTDEHANPISGRVKGSLNQVVVATTIGAKVEIDPTELKAKLKPYQREYLQGFAVGSLSSSRSQEACEVEVTGYATQLAEAESRKRMPTADYRNLAVNVDITAHATAFLLPIWCCEIKRQGKMYRIWLPGHVAGASFYGVTPADPNRANLSAKLKKAGNLFFGIGAFLCCSGLLISGQISTDQNPPAAKIVTAVSIIAAVVFLIVGSNKSQSGEAELKKFLAKSKEHRRNNMPRV